MPDLFDQLADAMVGHHAQPRSRFSKPTLRKDGDVSSHQGILFESSLARGQIDVSRHVLGDPRSKWDGQNGVGTGMKIPVVRRHYNYWSGAFSRRIGGKVREPYLSSSRGLCVVGDGVNLSESMIQPVPPRRGSRRAPGR